MEKHMVISTAIDKRRVLPMRAGRWSATVTETYASHAERNITANQHSLPEGLNITANQCSLPEGLNITANQRSLPEGLNKTANQRSLPENVA